LVEAKNAAFKALDTNETTRLHLKLSPLQSKWEEGTKELQSYADRLEEWQKGPKTRICEGLVKPDIVFFGEGPQTELLLVMGTSLQVMPFAGILGKVGPLCPRVLINREVVGHLEQEEPPMFFGNIGFRFGRDDNYRDVHIASDCDAGVAALVDLLGWTEELAALEGCATPPAKPIVSHMHPARDLNNTLIKTLLQALFDAVFAPQKLTREQEYGPLEALNKEVNKNSHSSNNSNNNTSTTNNSNNNNSDNNNNDSNNNNDHDDKDDNEFLEKDFLTLADRLLASKSEEPLLLDQPSLEENFHKRDGIEGLSREAFVACHRVALQAWGPASFTAILVRQCWALSTRVPGRGPSLIKELLGKPEGRGGFARSVDAILTDEIAGASEMRIKLVELDQLFPFLEKGRLGVVLEEDLALGLPDSNSIALVDLIRWLYADKGAIERERLLSLKDTEKEMGGQISRTAPSATRRVSSRSTGGGEQRSTSRNRAAPPMARGRRSSRSPATSTGRASFSPPRADQQKSR